MNRGTGSRAAAFLQWLPFLKGVGRINGRATAYVCIDYVCKLPTNELGAFRDILDGKQPGAAW